MQCRKSHEAWLPVSDQEKTDSDSHTLLKIKELKSGETYYFRIAGITAKTQTDDSDVCYTSDKVEIIGM